MTTQTKTNDLIHLMRGIAASRQAEAARVAHLVTRFFETTAGTWEHSSIRIALQRLAEQHRPQPAVQDEPLPQIDDWSLIVAVMHPIGIATAKVNLPVGLAAEVWALADGYDRGAADKTDNGWEHIRRASAEAKRAMAQRIRERLNPDQLRLIAAWIDEHGPTTK